MELRGLVYEDFINYKEPSMFLAMPTCDFKCCKEAGNTICQNMELANGPLMYIKDDRLIDNYMSNPITKAVVLGGLEPFDTWHSLYSFIESFREVSQDKVIIYTGYYKEEIADKVDELRPFGNIIIKYGRFIPNDTPHFDEVLGINLASNNQYAEEI